MKSKSLTLLMNSGSVAVIAAILLAAPSAHAGEAGSSVSVSVASGADGGAPSVSAAAPVSTSTGSSAADVLPTGATVRSGAAMIGSPSGGALTITQSTNRAIIDWTSFSIGSQNSVTFTQPGASSATLNRVTSNTPSTIAGSLSATGSVYLVNPNGIEITGTGAVSVGGGFVASTLNIADADFMAGKITFSGQGGGVSNAGRIGTAMGGFVALLGGSVANDGVISAPMGRVALGSGQAATLDLNGDRFLQVTIPADATDASGALISVNGSVAASGGRIEISAATARDAVRQAVNIPGSVNASSVSSQGGVIVLDAGAGEVSLSGRVAANGAHGGAISVSGDVVVNSGWIDASGAAGGTVSVAARVVGDFGAVSVAGGSGSGGAYSVKSGQTYLQVGTSVIDASGGAGGGSVSITSDGSLFTSGAIKAVSSGGVGGHVDLFGGAISMIQATVDASGASGGGRVRVGGDVAGGGIAPHADTVRISGTTTISADATGEGHGGQIVVWSNTESRVSGSLSARGGARGGDGGQADVSSGGQVGFSASVDVTAPAGKAGLLTLDPKFIIIEDVPPQGLGYDLLDPMPATGNTFAANAHLAASGDLAVVSDPTNSAIASHNGAVYVINIRTGAVVSALLGSHADDGVGAQTTIGDAAAYVQSTAWNAGRGAFTRFLINAAPNGIVSSSNSLVGSTPGDHIGAEVVELTTGPGGALLIGSPDWSNGAAAGAGAVTYVVGSGNPNGVVTVANSLVGATAGDNVGLGISTGNLLDLTLAETIIDGVLTFSFNPNPNPNFFVVSPNWHAGAAGDHAGAVTMFINGTPTVGTVSAANSLVGSHAGDNVGSAGLLVSPDYSYALLGSPNWSNGAAAGAGALTWLNVNTPTVGVLGASNSLVGGTTGDHEGLFRTPRYISNILFLQGNNNYLVTNHTWTNSATGAANAGAVTWGSASGGVSGLVSATNSLIGSSANDEIANAMGLSNGNYVVASPTWANTASGATFAGAVTWGNGATGTFGVVSAANSVVGTHNNDFVGGIGHYVLPGQDFYFNTIFSLGANGNYIISSNHWNGDIGAVTWVDGANGHTMDGSNTISSANSLVGAAVGDQASFRNFGSIHQPFGSNFFVADPSNAVGVTVLNNGNYVIDTTRWNNFRGAVTFGNGATGVAGVISGSNSVVGSSANDNVGFLVDPVANVATSGIILFPNGHDYLIASPLWRNPTTNATHAGAITFVSGTTGLPVAGNSAVSAANSLVGTQTNDLVGVGNGFTGGVFAGVVVKNAFATLPNGRIVAFNPSWANGGAAKAGAVTVFDPANPAATVGPITAINSLVGTTANDRVGYGAFEALALFGSSSGSPLYVLGSQFWTNPAGGVANAGAVTFFNPNVPTVGVISIANSIIGSNAGDMVGETDASFNSFRKALYKPVLDIDGNYIADPSFSNFLILTPHWNSGRGAITTVLVNGTTWTTADGTHTVSATNSLVGSQADAGVTPGDRIGTLSTSSSVDANNLDSVLGFWGLPQPQWHSNTGAVLWGNPEVPTVGVVGPANSLVGAQVGDLVGSGGLQINYQPDTFQNGVVISPNWANGAVAKAGAVTFINRAHPTVGVVGQANSLVGDQPNEQVGGGGVKSVYPTIIISTPGYTVGGVKVGAMTSLNPFTGEPLDLRNIVSTGNSVVGEAANASGLSYGGSAYQGGAQHQTFLYGTTGNYFLDTHTDAALPSDIVYLASGAGGQLTVGFTQPPQVQTVDFGLAPGSTLYIPPGVLASLLRVGDNVHLEANTDISVLSPLVVNNPVGDGGNLFLGAGRSIIINASITTDNGDLTLVGNDTAANGVTDANRDAGQAQITMGAGATISAGTGNVLIALKDGAGRVKTDGGAVTLGSITAKSIIVTNAARNPGAGAIVISPGATLTASGTGNSIVLAGGQFTNQSGAGALNVGGGARFLVYSNDWAADTRGGLTGSNLYNRTFAGSPPASQAAGGNLFIYERQPILSVTANSASRQYGDPNPVFGGSVNGLVNGDTAAYAYSGLPTFTSAAVQNSNVGPYPIVAGLGTLLSNVGYGFQLVNGQLTINPREVGIGINVRGDDKQKVYGTADPSLTYTVTSGSLVPGDSFTGALARDPGENVGIYAITKGTLALNNNYTLTFTPGAFTITAATLTYIADLKHRQYGDPNGSLTGAVTGFIAGESQASATTGTLTFASPAGAGSNVGTYAINGSGLTAGNYVFVQAAGNATALTVDPATLTYLANVASRLYGDANPAFSGTVSGLKNEDSLAGATTGTLAFSSPATPTSNVGNYAINGSGLTVNNGNYVFAQAASNATALTINPATLSYLANAASRIYGDTNGVLSGTVTGFKNADTVANATAGTLAFASPATATFNVGQYAINGSGLTANNGNYLFTQAGSNALALTITPATLTYVANPASRRFGDANPVFSGLVSGFKNADTAASATNGTLAFTSPATTESNVGAYAINGSGLSANNGNYTFVQAVTNATALTIIPRTITIAVAADNKSKVYGDADPALTYAVTAGSLANGDNFSGALVRDVGEDVGAYAIRQGTLALSANYTINFTNGVLTITAATLTYVATPTSRVYGDANGVLAGTVSGFKRSDTLANSTTGTLTFASPSTASSNVGTYAITGAGLTANHGNYVFMQAAGNAVALSVVPATLTYVATPASRFFGTANPALFGVVSGFRLSDTQASATSGAATFSTQASPASPVGQYAITGAGLTAMFGNYVFVQAIGNATALSVTAQPISRSVRPTLHPFTQEPGDPNLADTDPASGDVEINPVNFDPAVPAAGAQSGGGAPSF